MVWGKQLASNNYTDAPADFSLNLVRSARKGTGDTKTEWYSLFSTHFGITSAHTNPPPRRPNKRWGVLGRALVPNGVVLPVQHSFRDHQRANKATFTFPISTIPIDTL